MNRSSDEQDGRNALFDWYIAHQARHSTRLPRHGGPYHCPCCGHKTLPERGVCDICEVCYWEDDGQDDQDADVVRGGPNGSLSLAEARKNYSRLGACEESMVTNVRRPRPEELPN